MCFQIIAVLAALLVNLNAATASETFSIACETGAPARPYFVTFDTAARSAVLKTPPTDITAYSGINFNVGTISGDATKAKLEFRLQAISGMIDLVFDHDRQALIWPGIDSNTIRPMLIHLCKVLPARSILDFRAREPVTAPISVRCEDAGAMYFTMDVSSRRAIFERGAEGRTFQGVVLDETDQEIRLEMQFDGARQVVWNKVQGTIQVKDHASENRDVVMNCFKVPARTMLVYAERLARR